MRGRTSSVTRAPNHPAAIASSRGTTTLDRPASRATRQDVVGGPILDVDVACARLAADSCTPSSRSAWSSTSTASDGATATMPGRHHPSNPPGGDRRPRTPPVGRPAATACARFGTRPYSVPAGRGRRVAVAEPAVGDRRAHAPGQIADRVHADVPRRRAARRGSARVGNFAPETTLTASPTFAALSKVVGIWAAPVVRDGLSRRSSPHVRAPTQRLSLRRRKPKGTDHAMFPGSAACRRRPVPLRARTHTGCNV